MRMVPLDSYFLWSSSVDKYREIPAFSQILEDTWQNFSAVKTCWRREVDSNLRYSFENDVTRPVISYLLRFHADTKVPEKRK
jgi:hypothetical protein